MSLVFDEHTGVAKHFPKRRDVFEFDEEVSQIFEQMAIRSIPMYAQTHQVHAQLVAMHLAKAKKIKYRVADLGCSTAVFLKVMCNALGCSIDAGPDNVLAVAIDSSYAMATKVKENLKWVDVVVGDICTILETKIPYSRYDIVNMSYVLQFIPSGRREHTLRTIYQTMEPGGMLFLSQKEAPWESFGPAFDELYVDFRVDNGYSYEEIEAKTEALRKSMSIPCREETELLLGQVGFAAVQPTTRWLNFASYVCIKPCE